MMKKTHLAVGFAVALYFLPHVNDKIFFIPLVLIASLLPDIDSAFSAVGSKSIFRPIQWIFSHRGVIHSYTFAIFISLVVAIFYPVVALPIFLGYSFHLLLDSFTPMGIKPFWPFKAVSKGVVKSGGKVDDVLYVVFLFIDVVLAILFLVQMF